MVGLGSSGLISASLTGSKLGSAGLGGAGLQDSLSSGSSGDPSFSSVVLLTGFNGSIVDESPVGHTLTANGGLAVNTTTPLFGAGDLDFDRINDYVQIPDSESFNFGNGDFTIEGWFSVSFTPGAVSFLIGQWKDSVGSLGWGLLFVPTRFDFLYSYDGSTANTITNTAPAGTFDGTRKHFAIVRSGSNIRMWINGNSSAAGATDIGTNSIVNSSQPVIIGATIASNDTIKEYWEERLDEIRITKGVARYSTASSTITIPTEEFPRS